MKKEDYTKLKELRTLLANLHQEWEDDTEKDGHCKMSEGYVSVTLNYDNWFEYKNKQEYIDAVPSLTISVYSYLFGPNRMHDFNSLDEAILVVKTWKYKK